MFEKLKQKLLERIERDAVKSTMTYRKKRNSEPITETVYLKRSKMPLTGDWGRIHPPVNENGSWNIINLVFGGKKNLIKLLLIGMIVAMILLGYYELFSYIEVLKENCVPMILHK